MIDNTPFLFVHLPLDEVRADRLLDASPHRRHAWARRATLSADETFGACLELRGDEDSFVEFPPWTLNSQVFLPRSAGDPPKLTFTIWISPAAGDGRWNLIDCGLRPDLQRLKVGFRRTNRRLVFTALAPAARDQLHGYSWTGEADVPDRTWLHFALVWDPKGEAANEDYGDCRMFLNGGAFDSYGRREGRAPAPFPSFWAGFQTLLGWPSFHGRLAHFRIYTRELTQSEIAQEMDRDTRRLRMASPVACSLVDPLGRRMMFLDMSDFGEKMHVVVKPSRSGMRLVPPPPGPVGPDTSHLELAFRPGTLDLSGVGELSAHATDPPDPWEVVAYHRTRPDGHDSICLQCNTFPRLLPEGGLTVVLNTLKADRRFGPRSMRVDIRYRNLVDGQGHPLEGRVPGRLQLASFAPRPTFAKAGPSANPGWTGDPADSGLGLGQGEGRFYLRGHLICAAAQELMKRDAWQILAVLPAECAPFGGRELRFPGRVRWLSPAGLSGSKTLWRSDVIVAATGVVSIAADLPTEVLDAVGRIDVSLDGTSYSDEN